MGLKHLKRRIETIEVSDGDTFTVRGLDIVDIMALANEHRETLSELFAKFKDGDLESAMADSQTLIAAAFTSIPLVLIEIIALGANEDDLDEVRLLPMGVQVEAIEKIVGLTFATSSPKKILETIMRVMKSATEAMNRP